MTRGGFRLLTLSTVLLALCVSSSAAAQNYQILDQRLDESRHGYTVIRVWGSHQEMGHAMGAAFAPDILEGIAQLQADVGSGWDTLRAGLSTTVWQPAEIEDELAGIVAGVQAAQPGAQLDVLDLKILNTYSDWAYVSGCRSHSCWGQHVAAPVQTLSTRRLDYSTPFPMTLHHVLCAWDPGDGSPRWVGLSWPGYVAVITAVNAQGTVSSLHDFGPGAGSTPGLMPRSVAARHILTGMGALPVDQHLGWAQQQLSSVNVATSSFLNYFVPAGQGGVFTCSTAGPCGDLRTPQADYFGGEVLITTNDQTDGHSVPGGGDFMHDYYAQGGVKDLAGHFDLMGLTGLHLMSVEVRGEQDMTIWAHGRGRDDRIEVEWAALYAGSGTGGAGASGTGAGNPGGAGTGAGAVGAGAPAEQPPAASSDGCGCRSAGGPTASSLGLLALVFVPTLTRRRKRPAA